MTTLVNTLAEFACDALNGIPEEVDKSVRQRVLDILGLSIAAVELDSSKGVAKFVEQQGGFPESYAIGVGRVNAAWAAFNNGVLAHSLDYDDTHLPSILHPSASVVPTALAMAERTDASSDLTIRAIAAGIEITVRLGMAGYDEENGTSLFFENGQHATSICGAIGSAAAAALLQPHPTKESVANSMAVAVSLGSGVIEANRTGGNVKRIHCGWAAHSAVVAADLVSQGITGPPTALEGRFGFFQAWLHGEYNEDAILKELGVSWEVPKIFFKPYPANHFTHTAVDAAAKLREEGLTADSVESFVLEVASSTVRTIGEPIEVKRRPETGYQAQFSGPYAVALGFLGGAGLGASLQDYRDELAQNPRRRAIMAKVKVKGSRECDEIYPHQFPAILTAWLKDSTKRRVFIKNNRGGPQRPLTDGELETKYFENTAHWFEPDLAKEMSFYILGSNLDIRQLMMRIEHDKRSAH